MSVENLMIINFLKILVRIVGMRTFRWIKHYQYLFRKSAWFNRHLDVFLVCEIIIIIIIIIKIKKTKQRKKQGRKF